MKLNFSETPLLMDEYGHLSTIWDNGNWVCRCLQVTLLRAEIPLIN
ncbi:hypothetical protein O9993_23325 [Vibrio lentus]|nr:hypothetical protein [Vibrio lentus]